MKIHATPVSLFLFTLLTALAAASSARADGYRAHDDLGFGAEVNILWPLPPFRTYEIKFRGKVAPGVEAVIGYGHQTWTYSGKRHNEGRINSHALLLGSRAYLFGTGTSVEYTAWLGHDVFHHENGHTYRGFSYANEFYLGYTWYVPNSNVYVLPQWNAGFWSWKSYTMPQNDLYVFDFLPKISVGMDF
jgi:hypothetical protein